MISRKGTKVKIFKKKSSHISASFLFTWNGKRMYYEIIILYRKHNLRLILIDENGLVHYDRSKVNDTSFVEIIILHPLWFNFHGLVHV